MQWVLPKQAGMSCSQVCTKPYQCRHWHPLWEGSDIQVCCQTGLAQHQLLYS